MVLSFTLLPNTIRRIEMHEISKDLVQKEEYVNNTHQLDSVYGSFSWNEKWFSYLWSRLAVRFTVCLNPLWTICMHSLGGIWIVPHFTFSFACIRLDGNWSIFMQFVLFTAKQTDFSVLCYAVLCCTVITDLLTQILTRRSFSKLPISMLTQPMHCIAVLKHSLTL